MSYLTRVTSALEYNRPELWSWINKKAQAFLKGGVTDIHKIGISYDSRDEERQKYYRGEHQLMLRVPFGILNALGLRLTELTKNGFSDYASVNDAGLTLFYTDIPDFADIKHKGKPL